MYRIILYIILAIYWVSCSKESSLAPLEAQPSICWKVESLTNMQDGSASRALVEDYDDLRESCAGTERIGLFGSCYTTDGFTVAFNNTSLWWWQKENGNFYTDNEGRENHWNYDGDNVYWEKSGTYVFRAYYPKSKVTLQPGSDANQLLTVYNTEQSQYDLLAAYKELETNAENPVKLIFNHALSALKFNLEFEEEGASDELLSFWIENKKTDGLYTSSTLNFGPGSSLMWPKTIINSINVPMYYWEAHIPPTFTSNQAATAYGSSASSVEKGSLYTDNDGWLFIIPQTCVGPESVNICFKTATGGDMVYRAGLPAVTFEPGYRYNYHIKISSTEIKLSLTIADWNERKSSHDIDFNN